MSNNEYGNRIDYEYRPSEYAGDNIKVYDELKRLIEHDVIKTEWYLQCLPTCPLRDHSIVADLLEFWKNNTRPIFSAVDYDFPTQFAFTLEKNNSSWVPLAKNSPMLTGNTRSQDIKKLFDLMERCIYNMWKTSRIRPFILIQMFIS